MTRMNPTIKARWIEALRSGEYRQGTSYLHRAESNQYCCLGVLCELAVQDGIVTTTVAEKGGEMATVYTDTNGDESHEALPKAVRLWAGFDIFDNNPGVEVMMPDEDGDEYEDHKPLAELNDTHEFTFDTIADLIEDRL